jgi:hypothetical protein
MMPDLREGNPSCLKELEDNIQNIYGHILKQRSLSCKKYFQKVQSLY